MTSRDEYDIIKLSDRTMKDLGVSAQSILLLRTGNKMLRLRVQSISQEELDTYGDKALVTQENFDLLSSKSNKTSVIGVQNFEGLSLGCDPEFFLINRKHNTIQVASHIMREKMTTPLGLRVGPHGYLGTDGNSLLAELRPDPVMLKEQDTLIDNIANLIKALSKNRVINPKLTKPEAHSYLNGVAAGFHIHFGLGDTYVAGKGIVDEDSKSTLGVDEQKKILPSLITKSLDYHLGFLMRMMDPEYEFRSWKSEYGRAADFRLCKYTVEYRVPGGYFLATPQLASGLIGTAALIVSNTIPVLSDLTSGYKRSLVLDREKLEEGFNKCFEIPNLMQIKHILDGEETVSDVEMEFITKNVVKNLKAMKGHNEKTEWFIHTALKERALRGHAQQNPPQVVFSSPDLLNSWSKL